MPLVKISLRSGRSSQDKDLIAESIQSALVTNLGIPQEDRFALFTEYDSDNFRHTGAYLGMTYSEQLLIIEITFLHGRDDEIKKSLLADINRNLVAAGVVRTDDVFVMITEIGMANISFGQGQAQRAPVARTSG
jgi:phenylpyruvate tautomerase PptA (4-oxalocrotonate tautomerase family)